MRRTLALLALPLAAHAAGSCTQGWRRLATANPSVFGDNVLAAIGGTASDNIWAVGQYAPDSNPNVLATLAEHYDGVTWTFTPAPVVGTQGNALLGVAALPDGTAWAVGYSTDDRTFTGRALMERFDGSSWSVVPTPAPGVASHFFAISAASASDIWAVGEYQLPAGTLHTLTEHFDGRRWSLVPSPDPGATGNVLHAVLALSATDAWAAGAAIGTRFPDHALLLHWNGSAWLPAAPPQTKTATQRFYALAAAPGAILAAGEAEPDIAPREALPAQHAPGAPWVTLPAAQPAGGDNRFFALAVTPDGTAWAAGAHTDDASGNDLDLLETLAPGATAWTTAPIPNPTPGGNDDIAALATIGGHLFAAGAADGNAGSQSLVLQRCD